MKDALFELKKAKDANLVAVHDFVDVLVRYVYTSYSLSDFSSCSQLVAEIMKADPKHEGALNLGTRCALLSGKKKEATVLMKKRISLADTRGEHDELQHLQRMMDWLKKQPDDPAGLIEA